LAKRFASIKFDSAKSDYDSSQETFGQFRIVSIASILVGLVAVIFSWFSLRRSIGRPLDEALAQFDAIAAGDLRRELIVTSRDGSVRLAMRLRKIMR